MVVEDDIGINFQALILTAKLKGVDENIQIGLPGEDRNPLDHCTGDEVGGLRGPNCIAASHRLSEFKGSTGEREAQQSFD